MSRRANNLITGALLSLPIFVFAESSDVANTRYVYEAVDSLIEKYSLLHTTPQEYWQLTDKEWARYESLIQNSPWAQWQHHASPLAILSHYATSLDEKRRYARIEAELDQWRQHSSVLFQTLYDQERAIVSAKYNASIANRLPIIDNIQPSDHLQLYMRGDQCDPECRAIVSQILASGAHVDIFTTDTPRDEDIFSWAEAASIPVERVRVGQITLNRATGVLEVLANAGIELPALPVLLKRSAKGVQEVAL